MMDHPENEPSPIEQLKDIVEYRQDKKPEDEDVDFIAGALDRLKKQLENNNRINSSFNKKNDKDCFILLSLLYHPFLFLDLRPKYKLDEDEPRDSGDPLRRTTNPKLLTAYTIVQLVADLQDNFYSLLDNVDWLLKSQERLSLEMDINRETLHYSISVLSYIGYGLSLIPKNNAHFFPNVHSNEHILIRHLPLLHLLLSREEKFICEKGLTLGEKLVPRIKPKSLGTSFLDLIQQNPIDKSLIKIMRFSSIKSLRTRALSLFKIFVNCFNLPARYQLLYKTLADPDHHQGVQGLVLLMYKDLLANESDLTPFIGNNLYQIIYKALQLSLPNGVDTDLAESFDSICSLLNLIRYLLLRDKCDANETKIWNIIDSLKKDCIDQVWQAVHVSRARYKTRLNELEKPNQSVKQNGNIEPFQVKVLNSSDEEALSELSEDHEKESLTLALVNLDLVESIVGRINDIIDEARHAPHPVQSC